MVLDVVLNRVPYLQASLRVWAACDTGKVEGLLAAHAVTTVHYLIRGKKSGAETQAALELILRIFRVAPVDGAMLRAALNTRGADFEDEVTIEAALAAGCTWIVTRDPRGFRNATGPGGESLAVSPETMLSLIGK